MSQYSFIAADYELVELDNTNAKIITVREAIELGIKEHELIAWKEMDPDDEVLIFDNEEDLGELIVRKEEDLYEDICWYTSKSHIYVVEFNYTEDRGKDLLVYLKNNLKKNHSLEVWTIWLDEKKAIEPKIKNYNEISLDDIKLMFDSNNKNWENHNGIIIKNKF